ncbi:MAG: putative rane protein, partial [Candidatus Paceibacter sp.]|nr:putative rane protein [Candidatus Paceibacter sp.]
MLLFIAIIVVVIGYVHLTNRISDLEKIVKSGGVSRSPQPQIAISQPQPTVAVPSQGFEPTQTFVAQTVAPISTPAPMAAPVRTESSEEAGGRWLGKLGIIAVFIGISFFLKYAFDNNLIGVVGRVMIGLFAGIILLSLGQYLRKKYRLYSDVLIGGGIGVLYLTMYAAFAFYHLIDQPLALFFIAIITIIAMVMSYIDDSPSIAIMGTIGGFLTPLLLSLDRDSVVSLFSYVLILALGVLALSLRKKWVSLQYLTFAGTIFIVFTWCASFYNDTWLGVVMTFLTLYFLIFLATTFIRHFSRKEKASGGDLTFVSLNALGYFTMSYALLKPDYDPFLGFFALILAVVYLSLAWYSYLVNPDDETMNFYLPGLAFVFVTIAIPIQFSGSWITISWLIESLIIFFLAYAVNKPKHQVFGVIAYAIGVIKLFSDYLSQYNYSEYQPFMSEKFFFSVIAIIVAYCISYIYTI